MTGRLMPLRQFIVKVHGRCNLACDYCYVYESVDNRWRSRPQSMSVDVMDKVAERIGEYARTHELTSIDVILHGGEPLLAGHGKIRHLLSAVRSAVGQATGIRFVIQTNAVLLDAEFLAMFGEWSVQVGVSLDGDQRAHDRHRRSHAGRPTYDMVAKALRLFNEEAFRPLFAGLLCTVDVGNDPMDVYTGLMEFAPPMIDFLLPHGNWNNPPPRWVGVGGETPYADWLIPVFDEWYAKGDQQTRIRVFEAVIDLLLGGRSQVEGLGLEQARMVVVETDGSIERSDVLSTAYEGAASTGLNVAGESFDTAMQLPLIPVMPTAELCSQCDVHTVCGGGLPAHRYREGRGFGNPSVYCADLRLLIRHIRRTVSVDLVKMVAR